MSDSLTPINRKHTLGVSLLIFSRHRKLFSCHELLVIAGHIVYVPPLLNPLLRCIISGSEYSPAIIELSVGVNAPLALRQLAVPSPVLGNHKKPVPFFSVSDVVSYETFYHLLAQKILFVHVAFENVPQSLFNG